MEKIYLVTGATGFLGRAIVRALLQEKKQVVGLCLPQCTLPRLIQVPYEEGDITKISSLKKFFSYAHEKEAILIHCASMISIASKVEKIWEVNVEGTRNLLQLSKDYGIAKFVYVSSVHAIEEAAKGKIISETQHFSPEKVKGIYAKTKAAASALVLEAAKAGLDTVIVHPSGMLGPEDYARGYLTETVQAMMKGYFLLALEGGYDFVDVRDVAQGVLRCAEKGEKGENYILSGHYLSIQQLMEAVSRVKGKAKKYKILPLWTFKWAAPLIEKIERLLKLPLLITPYSLDALSSNGNFCNEKAKKAFSYTSRPIEETLADILSWMYRTQQFHF